MPYCLLDGDRSMVRMALLGPGVLRSLYRALPVSPLRASILRKTGRWHNGVAVSGVRAERGLQFDLTLGDPVETEIYLGGEFEPTITDAIVAAFTGQRVFYDIGCNMGWFSCVMGRELPAARIVAIDANPLMARKCTENCARNGIRADVLNVGVGSARQRLVFNYRADRPSMGSFGSHVRSEGASSVEVDVLPFSELISERGLPPPTCLKIDIEGFEPALFTGISDAHMQGVEALILEHSPPMMTACGLAAADLWRNPRMAAFRYRGLIGGRGAWRELALEQLPAFDGMVIGVRR